MSHGLATINGQTAMAYIDSTPWHNLGTDIRRQLAAAPLQQRIDVALEAAGLNFQVASLPLYLADGTELPGHKAAVRLNQDGTTAAVFGPVGENHKPIQNGPIADIARPLVEEFSYVPAAAGALDDGARCWMLFRAADLQITPVDGDAVNGYALLYWGHNGQLAVSFLGTGVRVVCQNTLGMATNGKKAWIKVRHSGDTGAKLDQAAELVRGLAEAMRVTGDTFRQLAGKLLTANQLKAYIAAAIPDTGSKPGVVSKVIEARRDTVLQLVHDGKGADMANQLVNTADGGASVWAAFNAVTEYFDHVRPAEAQSDAGRANAFESAIFGGNAEIKADALTLASQLIAA